MNSLRYGGDDLLKFDSIQEMRREKKTDWNVANEIDLGSTSSVEVDVIGLWVFPVVFDRC